MSKTVRTATHLAAAKCYTDAQLMEVEDPCAIWCDLYEILRHAAHVYGVTLSDFERMSTMAPGGNILAMNMWAAVKAKVRPNEPTPGYDADGRETWEYP